MAEDARRYAKCDDGGTAELSAEATARLLADHWHNWPPLAAQIGQQQKLKRFMLNHITETLDTADLKRICSLAASPCPAAEQSLCHAIETKTRSATN